MRKPAVNGLAPVNSRPLPAEYEVPDSRGGQVLQIDGREVRLAGIPRPPGRLRRWLAILGPGLIAVSAGNDAGGIATYSSAGAQYGYQLIWVLVLLIPCLGVVQEMCARMGAATGRGLLDLIRQRYGLVWSLLATVLVLSANLGLIVSEFSGLGAAGELLGLNRFVVVPVAALGLWLLILFGSFELAQRVLILMTLVFFAYPIAAILGQPDWGEVVRGAVVPTLRADSDYLYLLVGLLGTTITPFMQVFHQSSTVESGAARGTYGPERWDAYVGALFSNLMSVCMLIATAATLYHTQGPQTLESAAEAARALEPVAGASSALLFAVGLSGATLLAAAVVPLATAYAVAETLGSPRGVGLDFRRAPLFFGTFTAMLWLGAVIALLPGIPVMSLLLGTQVFNGVLLPVLLFFVLLLTNDRSVMGRLKNGPATRLLGWASFLVICLAVGALGLRGLLG